MVVAANVNAQVRTGLAAGGNRMRTIGPAPAKGSSGRCQSGTAARKAEPLTASGPKRQCLPGVAAHSLSLRGGTASSSPSSSTGESCLSVERWVTRSGRRKDISAWSGPRLFNAAGLAELSLRCDLGRPRAWAALAARLHRSGGPAASASDDAVLTQARDRGGVEAEPVGKHFFGVLAEQWR